MAAEYHPSGLSSELYYVNDADTCDDDDAYDDEARR